MTTPAAHPQGAAHAHAARPRPAARPAESDVPETPQPERKPKRTLCVVRDLDGRYVENAWLVVREKGDAERCSN